ncbi:hypothetical protein EUBSIR_00429 [[Eubacterium] siraeum DSM 15702]|uniref:Uncharacterized protein n=1 Tax=[Eubacterium] siraeum DSM 15702 TaxID=428128 RepID=B0MKT6_9FIRM|nr:hypothetical protein EUBSIR_00429 [[Eubacterium] siraeum DSM 15702]UWP24673.1 phage tail family protein [[Eubacterium] siraeum]
MEKITFSTVLGTAVTIDNVNTSSDADGYIPLHLLSFEGNALGYKHDSSERVGFDGAGFYGAKANIRTIIAEIALLPRSGKPATMYELRRKLLRYFPGGVEGTLKYTNSAGKTYQIEGVVSELPAVERQVGVLCTAKITILSYVPFWRVKAGDVEVSAGAGKTQSVNFTAQTEDKVPAMLYISAPVSMAGTDTHSAIITLSGQDKAIPYSYMSITGKEPQRGSKTITGELQLTKYLSASDVINIDWGLLGKVYIPYSQRSGIDLIKSTSQYIYPGTNTLSVKNIATAGTIKAKLVRFDYVRSI